MIPPCDLISISAGAGFAGVTTRTVYQWIRKGKVRVWGRPGSYRVSLEEILPEVSIEGSDSSVKGHGLMVGKQRRAVQIGD